MVCCLADSCAQPARIHLRHLQGTHIMQGSHTGSVADSDDFSPDPTRGPCPDQTKKDGIRPDPDMQHCNDCIGTGYRFPALQSRQPISPHTTAVRA